MAGGGDVTARGAMEAGERGGGQPQADLAGAQDVEGARVKCVAWGHAAFYKGKAVGKGGLRFCVLQRRELRRFGGG
jgi:hypothetical protein